MPHRRLPRPRPVQPPGGHPFEILQGLDGHMAGKVYLTCPDLRVLFTGDSLISMEGLTPWRRAFNSPAVNPISSVNVDRDLARKERAGLIALAAAWDAEGRGDGRRCLVCGGHGPVSVLDGESLVTFGAVERYRP